MKQTMAFPNNALDDHHQNFPALVQAQGKGAREMAAPAERLVLCRGKQGELEIFCGVCNEADMYVGCCSKEASGTSLLRWILV